MSIVRFSNGECVPIEMHKVKIIQKLNLRNVDTRLKAINEAGNNSFLLKNDDVFLDMLTDSGSNAMSDHQLAAMMIADDSYAGSATFYRLEAKLQEIFGMEYFLPTHQGRAAENIISQVFVEPGDIIPMNYHFTTSKSHITLNGGIVEEIIIKEGLEERNNHPFKGNVDIEKLEALAKTKKIAFVRVEAGTNLIGGQPVSLKNLQEVRAVCDKYNLMLVYDASLLADNLYFIHEREEECKDMSIREITKKIADACDIIYFSARKLGCARGGGICLRKKEHMEMIKELIPLYEGFLTYGGMSVREMEAITVGLEETMDIDMISQAPQFIKFMVDELDKLGVPVITPAGGLGCHVDAKAFLDHLPQTQYPAGALVVAYYIISGVRGMERGTLSEQREPDGTEIMAKMELMRLALPRRVFTLSQVKFAVDRLDWLYKNRKLIGGLEFYQEPSILRFFFGRLRPISNWQEKLVEKFKKDFGDSL